MCVCVLLTAIALPQTIHAQDKFFCLVDDDTTIDTSRTNYQSWNGWYHQTRPATIKPTGTYRILNIFVNIYYDQTNSLDPAIGSDSEHWPATTQPGINNPLTKPDYLTDLMDVDYNPGNVQGILTRLLYESSFGSLLLLGDFMVVDIKQSYITPDNPGGDFTLNNLRNKVFSFINENGGLNTIHGHNSLADYDSNGDGNIDMVQFITRNTRSDTIVNFGNLNSGSGNVNMGSYNLKINGQMTEQNSVISNSCAGTGINWVLNPTGIVVHEFSHVLFGSNHFHASGGNHYLGGNTNTWFGFEGGYGLMGGYNSGLVSCNSYERWRMNWTSPIHNPNGYEIQANGLPSDISKNDGPQSFTLRDFVTTGDAVRIKLPYVDEGASNQYIWLENHQIGENNKLDYLQWSLDHNLEPNHEYLK